MLRVQQDDVCQAIQLRGRERRQPATNSKFPILLSGVSPQLGDHVKEISGLSTRFGEGYSQGEPSARID
jgi:hypothetical protein